MEGYTLVAIIKTTRSATEYLARNRGEIIETFDALMLDVGDVIQIRMEFVSDAELATLTEAAHEEIVANESGLLALPTI